MLQLVVRRLLQLIGLAVLIGSASFFMMHALPGDLAARIAASRYGPDLMSTQAMQAVRLELGLDQALTLQWAQWLAQLLQGNLGFSLASGEPVWDELSHQMGTTLLLSFCAMAIALVVGTCLGFCAAMNPHRLISRAINYTTVFVKSLPLFLIGLLLILWVAYTQVDIPIAGHGQMGSILLPSLTLALPLSFGLARVVAATTRPILDSTMVEFARIKGLSRTKVLALHVLPNILNPLLAYSGTQIVLLIEGAIIVESIFAWPGIGHALVHAIFGRDIPLIQGTALAMTGIFVALNAALDLIMMTIDPRLKNLQAAQ